MFTYYAPARFCPTFTAVLAEVGATRTDDLAASWDLYLTSSSASLKTLLPSRTDQWLSRLPNAGHLSNKTALWLGLLEGLGRDRACALMPESWQLDQPDDVALLDEQPRDTVYIAKHPVLEQRKGLRLCGDVAALHAAAEDGHTLAQRLLPDLLLVDGHRFHLRLYVVVLYRDGVPTMWRHQRGRCIWAPAPMGRSLLEHDAVITRGAALLPGRPIDLAGLLAMLHSIDTDDLMDRVDAMLSAAASVIIPSVLSRWSFFSNPAFHLLGADVVVDAGGGVRLIELNSGPDLRPRSPADRVLKRSVVRDLLRLIALTPGDRTGFMPLPVAHEGQ